VDRWLARIALIAAVELRIKPEPDQRERDAIERAVRRLLARDATPPGYRSRWRRAGLDFAPEWPSRLGLTR
jgi:hypothetical protein